MTLHRLWLLSAALVPLLLATSHAVIFYDVDFSSPRHVVGQPPATGGTNAPSAIVFGSPMIVSAYGGLTDQSALFNTAGNSGARFYEQIRFNLGLGEDLYRLSMDLQIDDLIGGTNSLTILFDTPQVRTVRFQPDGFVDIWGANPFGALPYQGNRVFHLDIEIDLVLEEWSIYFDRAEVHRDDFSPSGNDVDAVRIDLSGVPIDSLTNVAIDNLQISNEAFVIPEPSRGVLIVHAFLSALLRRRVI